MNEQKKLPRPCPGLTFKVRINNNAIFLRTGEYEDGKLGEIFIDMYKEGAGYKAILGNFSITISWLLQYGVPLERLVEKFMYTKFEPAGSVVGDDNIKMCNSILDYVFRRLGITYLGRDELGNIKKETDHALLRHELMRQATSELPPFAEEIKGTSTSEVNLIAGKEPDIQIYTLASGSLGLRPVGYKSEEFLNFCRKNKHRHNKVHGKFELDFNKDSIVIFDKASNQERDTNAVKGLWFEFYGKKLDLGDI